MYVWITLCSQNVLALPVDIFLLSSTTCCIANEVSLLSTYKNELSLKQEYETELFFWQKSVNPVIACCTPVWLT